MTARAGRRFEGSLALVTGAAHGIGRACAERLAAEGARVAVADVDETAAGEVVAALEASHPAGHLGVALDVLDPAAVDAAVERAVGGLGGLDVLVCVAGGDFRPADELTDEQRWVGNLELNLLGTVRAIRAAEPHLRRSTRSPAIVTTSSVNGLTGLGLDAYSAAKAGLGSLTQNLAVRLGPHGIRVNTVAPGTVRTRLWEVQPGGADRMVPLYPLGRVGEPEDIAAAVAFLASSDAGWVTGVVLPVDGGLLAGRPSP